jgi:hypothetical protein
MKEWLATLAQVVSDAQHDGQFDKRVDPTQLACEINALELAANWAFQLYGDQQAFARARAATLERLHRHATASGLAVLPALIKKNAKSQKQSGKRNAQSAKSKVPHSKRKELKSKGSARATGVQSPGFSLRARQKAT